MAQINIAGYGRKYKNPVNTSSVRSPIRRIASAVPSITKQSIYESVTDPMSMLPDLYNVPSDNTSDTASPGFQGNPSKGATQDEADSIMSNAMGFGPSGIAKKAASLGWNAITSPFTMGVPFAESVADIGFGAVNTNRNAMALGDIMTQNEAVTPSAVNSVFKGQYSDQLGAIAPFANNEKGMQSLKSLTALSDKANFDKAHPILGFAKDTVYDPIKRVIDNVFGSPSPPENTARKPAPIVDFANPINKGMGELAGFGYATPEKAKAVSWSEETNPTDLSVVESVTKGHTAMSGIGKKGIPTFQMQALDPVTNTYSTVSDPFSLNVTDVESPGSPGSGSSDSSSSSSGGIGMGPGGNTAGGHGEGGTGSGSGKIVCSAMNQMYGFGDYRNKAWLKYSAKHLKPEHATGYHFIFMPLVKFGFKSGNKWYHLMLRKILEHIAIHRTDDLNAEMNGTNRDIIGMCERFVLEPVCFWTGRYIERQNENRKTRQGS